jgi:hypothetical protein
MKLEPLPKLKRRLRVAFVVASSVSSASIAHASMSCLWLDEIPPVSDPLIRQKPDAHVKTLPGLENYEMWDLSEHYFMLQAVGKSCKEVPRCEHHLIELREGVVRNVFAFRGTGMVRKLWSPPGLWIEDLGDDYSFWAFRTTPKAHTSVSTCRDPTTWNRQFCLSARSTSR